MQRRIQRVVGMILSLAAAGAILFVAGRLSSGPSAPPQASPAALASAPRTDAPARGEAQLEAGTRSTVPDVTVHTGTLRELLEKHYGMPWETVRGLLADEDVDPGRVARLCEWEQVAPQMRREVLFSDGVVEADTVRSALSWGGIDDKPSWYGGLLNPEKKPLAEVDLQNLERMNAEYDSRLRDLADAANQMIPRCMAEQFDRQDFARAPLVETKECREWKQRPSEFTRLVSTSGAGWNVKLRFQSVDYPELESLGQDIRELKQERYERLRDYIAAR